ncbi:MAG: bifunctional lysine ketoglutarate reductase /saccharopine dehydrogenase family protein [Desulfobacterales bacterium]
MKSILIRREDKNRWERRAALIPDDLKAIVEQTAARAYVETSDKRIFPAEDYQQAGAELCESMAPGDVILGIKEIPVEKILADKIYLFFSHTIKGQPANMPLLRKIMDSGSTLIDYERISDADNRRIVFFGRYAGDAGAIDILSLMGEYWMAHGLASPLAQIKRAHQYASVADAQAHLKTVGETIGRQGFPSELAPLSIGILGYGNVSSGAQQILECLPLQQVAPGEIAALLQSANTDARKIYVTIFKEENLVQHQQGAPFDLEEYFLHPERYQSVFEAYLPHYTLLINAVYWESRYPRFVTWEGLAALYRQNPTPKLQGIADITCDTQGSIECNVRATDSDLPAYQVDPLTRQVRDGHTGDGLVLLAVDNLPCELPHDASTFFSRQLAPLVPNILRADFNQPLAQSGLSPEVEKAVVVYKGQLTERYSYLQQHLDADFNPNSKGEP